MSKQEEVEKFYKNLGFITEDTGGGFLCYQKVAGDELIRVTCEAELPTDLNQEIEVGVYDQDEEPLDVVFLGSSRELVQFLAELQKTE